MPKANQRHRKRYGQHYDQHPYDAGQPEYPHARIPGGVRSHLAMLRRLNAQEMPTAGTPSQSEWEGKGDLTLSLITNGSMTTFSSAPGTPSFVRLGGDGFIPQPSALKESKAAPGGGLTSRIGMRRRQEQSPLVHAGVGWGEMSEKDERYLRPTASWIYLRCIPCLHGPCVSIGDIPSLCSTPQLKHVAPGKHGWGKRHGNGPCVVS